LLCCISCVDGILIVKKDSVLLYSFLNVSFLRSYKNIFNQKGNHILIDREDRKSQLRTFKDGMSWLNKGVSLMAFPEGMRSKDGRLMDFKKGIFSMAVKANVPIIPITICHTHAVMPSYSILPIQSGRNKLHIHINEPISSTGRTEAELEQIVRTVFLTTLPECQLPLHVTATPTPIKFASIDLATTIATMSTMPKQVPHFVEIVQETNNKDVQRIL
jgi:1-acyl-sn-glycerol-3-phosphate acyltransferase